MNSWHQFQIRQLKDVDIIDGNLHFKHSLNIPYGVYRIFNKFNKYKIFSKNYNVSSTRDGYISNRRFKLIAQHTRAKETINYKEFINRYPEYNQEHKDRRIFYFSTIQEILELAFIGLNNIHLKIAYHHKTAYHDELLQNICKKIVVVIYDSNHNKADSPVILELIFLIKSYFESSIKNGSAFGNKCITGILFAVLRYVGGYFRLSSGYKFVAENIHKLDLTGYFNVEWMKANCGMIPSGLYPNAVLASRSPSAIIANLVVLYYKIEKEYGHEGRDPLDASIAVEHQRGRLVNNFQLFKEEIKSLISSYKESDDNYIRRNGEYDLSHHYSSSKYGVNDKHSDGIINGDNNVSIEDNDNEINGDINEPVQSSPPIVSDEEKGDSSPQNGTTEDTGNELNGPPNPIIIDSNESESSQPPLPDEPSHSPKEPLIEHKEQSPLNKKQPPKQEVLSNNNYNYIINKCFDDINDKNKEIIKLKIENDRQKQRIKLLEDPN